MTRFENKVAFVSGAASGIGLATMTRLASEGASVYAVDINAQALSEAANKLQAQGFDILSQTLDVTDEAASRAAIEACRQHFGRLNVLCNIAGMVMNRHFADISSADWNKVMEVNVSSVFVLCQAAMPHLLESQGNIVNISSAAGLAGLPYQSVYCASKGAVLLLSKALAAEFAAKGVRVNAICPGAVNTPLIQNVSLPDGADADLYQRMYPLTPYFAEPEEIAGAVAYLASAEARFVTGSALTIDGGQTSI